MSPEPATRDLPLFPLASVLFPGALLQLKVFEVRYLDLIGRCLRAGAPFGVVCLAAGREVGRGDVRFERAGTLARIDEVDAATANILRVRCSGGERFEVEGQPRQQDDGLWLADVRLLPGDDVQMPSPEHLSTVKALQTLIASMRAQGNEPFAPPYRLDDAGWVANRWCEVLPIPVTAKHKLMLLSDPQVRLRLVHEYLKGKGVV